MTLILHCRLDNYTFQSDWPLTVLWYLYRLPLKGILNNKEVDKLVEEPCERVPLKEAAKARLAAAVAAEAAAQVEDDVTSEEEKLDEQYAAVEIDYENKAIGEV